MPEVNDWRMVRRMSVTSTRIESIPDSPNCSALTTLIFQENEKLKWISGDFFRWMTSLVLLDLSSSRRISELPEEVSSLVSLQFLNLSGTTIERLPLGLKELKRLIHLDLDYTYRLREIDVIASLLNLQVLRLFMSGGIKLKLVEDLQLLQSLTELSLTVIDDDAFQRLVSIPRLASCIRRLYLLRNSVPEGGLLFLKDSLRELEISKCSILEIDIDWRSTIQRETKVPQFRNIHTVYLVACEDVKDLTWLLLAPILSKLRVYACGQIEQIISREKAMAWLGHTSEQPFQNLTMLSLTSLRRLRSIYWAPLPFPVLKNLGISNSPEVKRLPLNSESAKGNQFRLYLDKKLINEIEWEDEATKQRFYSV